MIWLRSVSTLQRRSTAQSLLAASFFAIQIAAAAFGITGIYAAMGNRPGVTWAVVSAILVLYPGITQSLSAALLRIAANLLGSAIGFVVGSRVGIHMPEIVLALVITIFAGELLRMDLALRTACVASVIVMSANEHNVGTTVVERVISVVVGCAAALVVQIASAPLRRFLPFVADTEATAQQTGTAAKPAAPTITE